MRKKKLVLLILGLSLAITIALALWAFVIEPNRLVVDETTIAMPNWPAAANGLKIVSIGDIHGGSNFITPEKIRRIVTESNATNPDVIVLLGDFVTGHSMAPPRMAPEVIAENLKGLRARYGVFAVMGNHDWWTGGPRMIKALQDIGIRVLEREAAAIVHNGQTIWLLGVPDFSTRWPVSLVAPLEPVNYAAPVIVLTHSPDAFPELVRDMHNYNFVLTLAAHTHGGQVKLPLLGARIVPSLYGRRYVAGLIRDGRTSLFVTTGIGTSVFPIRFGVPPEIAVLTLIRQ